MTEGLIRALQIVQAEIDRSEFLLSVGEGAYDRPQVEAGIAALRTIAAAIEREIAALKDTP